MLFVTKQDAENADQSRQKKITYIMKMLYTTMALLLTLVLSNPALSQVEVGNWEMHRGNEGIVKFRTSNTDERKKAFEIGKKNLPGEKASGWSQAKTSPDGTVDFSEKSVLTQCGEQLDFTYFQTMVFVPTNENLSHLTLSYDEGDDGARIYFFNSKYPNGSFSETSDLIGNQKAHREVDLKDQIVKGEHNRIVIVQYDQCPVLNKVRGVRIKANGKEIKPTVLPDKFKLHAYSVNGQRVEKGSNYYMAFNPSEQGDAKPGRILNPGKGTVLNIVKETVDASKGIVALKVANGPSAGMYLTVTPGGANYVKVQKSDPKDSKAQFVIRSPVEKEAAGKNFVSFESVSHPDHFLRHAGYVLMVSPANDANFKNKVYRHDASWLFEPIQ